MMSKITSDYGKRKLMEALELCSEHWGIDKEIILTKSRESVIMNARHSVRYYLCNLNQLSLSEIGALTGCDHATVINSRRKFEYYCHTDPDFVNLKARINGDLRLLKSKMLRNKLMKVINSNMKPHQKVTNVMSIYENR